MVMPIALPSFYHAGTVYCEGSFKVRRYWQKAEIACRRVKFPVEKKIKRPIAF